MKGEQIFRFLGVTAVVTIVVLAANYWLISTGIYAGLAGLDDAQFFSAGVPITPIAVRSYRIALFLPAFPLLGLVVGLITRWRRAALAELLLQIGCVLTVLWAASLLGFHEKWHRDVHRDINDRAIQLENVKPK